MCKAHLILGYLASRVRFRVFGRWKTTEYRGVRLFLKLPFLTDLAALAALAATNLASALPAFRRSHCQSSGFIYLVVINESIIFIWNQQLLRGKFVRLLNSNYSAAKESSHSVLPLGAIMSLHAPERVERDTKADLSVLWVRLLAGPYCINPYRMCSDFAVQSVNICVANISLGYPSHLYEWSFIEACLALSQQSLRVYLMK